MTVSSADGIEKYYDSLWNRNIYRYQRLTHEELARGYFIISEVRKMKPKSGKMHILDVGCGRGWLTNALAKYGEVLGVDLSIKAATRVYPKLKFLKANFVTDQIDGIYDVIVATEIIEHLSLKDQESFMKKCYELLVDGGHIILTTPNTATVSLNEANSEEWQPEENWITRQQLFTLMRPYFKIEYAGSVLFFPRFIRKRKWLAWRYGIVLNMFHKVIHRLLGFTFYGMQLAVLGRRL